MKIGPLDLSVLVPFGDDEEVIGTAVRRTALYLREQGLSFELLAIDEGSGDNSPAILSLLRSQLSELRLLPASRPGRGIASGAAQARGRVVVVCEPSTAAVRPLAPLGRAVRRVGRGELDVVAVGTHFVACHRTRSLSILESSRGGPGFPRRLARRARSRKLEVEAYELGGDAVRRWPRQRGRSLARLVELLAPARVASR